MSGLNMAIIKGMPIPLPPLVLQRQFADVRERINHLIALARTAAREHGEVCASLEHSAFRGEL